ncbi:MAG: DUF2304 family protein [Patescibacteria group bacterium]|nr:DUF2304 family protein [Patescibacteria group bacterium]
MIIKIFIILFIIFVLSRTFIRFRAKDITIQELVIWSIFWSSVAIATLIPRQTDALARMVGVARGADLLVYISIIVLFFVVFKIVVKLEKISRDITKIVRHQALNDKEYKDNESR